MATLFIDKKGFFLIPCLGETTNSDHNSEMLKGLYTCLHQVHLTRKMENVWSVDLPQQSHVTHKGVHHSGYHNIRIDDVAASTLQS
jgi:hypothetical protein